ncbi:hypothetical protein PNF30_16245 [Bacillus safensis]|uniref:hypothetical protein n=1 Tax=Bacillus safensis TaxID=561879 RepID=UPI002342F57B|nr:hypothetical protein [Bacillus safensis]WCL57029.1 hypothetical protein PNF30_16245 [Bacillus safensis]
MTFLNYQYCLSDFVVVDDYEIEYFTVKDDECSVYATERTILDGIAPTKLAGQVRRVFVKKEDIDFYITGVKEYHSYNPLNDTPELFLEMNKIKPFNEKSLMKFIKNYGIPFHGQKPTSKSPLADSILFRENASKKFLLGMDVIMFYIRLIVFQEALIMWNDIVKGNISKMKKIRDEFESEAKIFEKYQTSLLEKSTPEDFSKIVLADLGLGYIGGGELEDVLRKYKDNPKMLLKLHGKASELKTTWSEFEDSSDLKATALAYLNLKLKSIQNGEITSAFFDGRIVPAIRFNNLLEVAAYQLKQAIFKDQKLEECLNCGALFEPRHASRKFCPPLPGRKRSTCENTYNQRLKRLRKNNY